MYIFLRVSVSVSYWKLAIIQGIMYVTLYMLQMRRKISYVTMINFCRQNESRLLLNNHVYYYVIM